MRYVLYLLWSLVFSLNAAGSSVGTVASLVATDAGKR